MDDDPRQVGPFRIIERLGAGGMGRVYLGRAADGRAVAVKTARRELADGGSFRKRFAREVAAAQRVGGPFVAPVIDAAPEADVPWMATEYVPGLSLTVVVDRYGPLPEHTVTLLASGLLQALSAVHDQGLVHRDLKPSNIILTSAGPRVIDFGIAYSAIDTVLTTYGAVLGTPGFMAPEQLAMGSEITEATDVFAFGSVLVFAATGNGPFGTGHPQVLMYRTMNDAPRLDSVPGGLARTVAACLDKPPDRRPTVAALGRHFGTHRFDNWLTGPLDSDLRRIFARLNDPRVAFSPRAADSMPTAPGTARPTEGPIAVNEPRSPAGASAPGGGGSAASTPGPGARPASPRMSRRGALAALSFAGIAAGGGALSWALWPEGKENGANGDEAAPRSPDGDTEGDGESSEPPPAETGAAVFELPSGKVKIDAVMPVPDDPVRHAPSGYWLFTGDQYLRARLSADGYPVRKNLKGPSGLDAWNTIGTQSAFRDGIDAVLRVPGRADEYWIFSRDRYMRIRVDPHYSYYDSLKAGPRPISDWSEAFGGISGDGVDAIVPVPDDPHQVWVFSGSQYVRTRLNKDGTLGGEIEINRRAVRDGWPKTLGSTEGFSDGFDAALPLPGEPNKYWVFSGSQYMKINVTDVEYDDTVLQPPRELRTEQG
ncbi:protein kinase [Streptomyces sp. NPDC026589]|uniref:protein kinase domain-containing protein n=1 Tax=Streptomyces sp. NPDC026589 TaxID=3155609 RepID=UPI0033DD5E66